jgi:hypothetical protein
MVTELTTEPELLDGEFAQLAVDMRRILHVARGFRNGKPAMSKCQDEAAC